MNILTIISAIIIFLAIIWLLVGILLFARKKMIPEGSVKININGKKEIEHERGCTLLQALADAQVFVPSACGGGGSCGTCRGKVLSGGGDYRSLNLEGRLDDIRRDRADPTLFDRYLHEP